MVSTLIILKGTLAMFKKFISICALALSVFVFISPVAQAGDHCGCMSMNLGHKMHEAMEKLNLTAEQKDKIKAIKEKAHEAMKSKHEEMHNLMMMINASYKDGSMNEAKVDEYANKKMHIIGAVIKTRMMERLEISKILTPEQKEKLSQMIHEALEHHMKKHPKSCHGMQN